MTDHPPGDEAKDKEQVVLEYDSKEPNAFPSSPSEKSEGRSGSNAHYAVDPMVERRLLWKFDCHLLPTLAVMYLFK